MAFYDSCWYLNSVGYAAVTVRPQNTAVVAGVLRRQFTAPTVGNERVFVCIVAGTTANTTDATWVLTRGAKTTDGTATWQECTGASAVNGDLTNTVTWATAKATGTPTLGAIIKRNSGASYQICSTAGTMAASEPTFSDTAGVTTTDGTSVWTSLGPVGNFTGGQAPHARIVNATTSTWFATGNTVFIASNHAETQAAAVTVSATSGRVLCHNVSGSYPPGTADLTIGATVITTGANNIAITNGYFYGIAFQAGTGAVTATINLGASVGGFTLDACSLQLPNTGTSSRILLGGSGASASVILNNTTMKFAATAQAIDVGGSGNYVWQNTPAALAAGSSVPSSLFNFSVLGGMITVLVEAVDLSAISGTLIAWSNNMTGSWTFKDCKLHASVTPTAAPGFGTQTVELIRCDSGAKAYTSSRYARDGTETTETSITRVGGAVDPSGQAQSRKIVTIAATGILRPFRAEPYAIWNSTTGATVTVTVCGTVNAGALPMNDDIWLEVEYLSSSGSPLGTIVSTSKSNVLATSAAVASDGSSWNGGGSGAGWSPFKLVAALSSPQPGLAGYIDVRVRAAKASTTYYIDPKIDLT